MYVVKIQNDEATMYRAFRRFQSAKAWISGRGGDDPSVHIFKSPDAVDTAAAVLATREGCSALIESAELLRMMPAIAHQARDFGFSRARRREA